MHNKKNKPSILYLLSYYNITFIKNPVFVMAFIQLSTHQQLDLNFAHGVPWHKITIFQFPF